MFRYRSKDEFDTKFPSTSNDLEYSVRSYITSDNASVNEFLSGVADTPEFTLSMDYNCVLLV